MKIDVKGAIVSDSDKWIYDWLDIQATSPRDINRALEKANGEEVEVIINSGGGDVFSGSEIYTALKDYRGKTTGKIVGIAASAASVAAMGVDVLSISPTAQVMIHRASMVARGNAQNFENGATVLKGIDKSIANAYILKTGMQQEELLNLMSNETFMTAQEAKEKGFVDSIMFDDGVKFAANMENGMLPQKLIDKIRNELKGKITNEIEEGTVVGNSNNEELEIAKAKLKLQLI
ncbi:head maturation protease, ClpP-related [Tepidibacter mesophilus]|uniref:head maturation protease, ClpP-related n=1 Tax=Tepidibacter mesophilus TaxID=655607 RepID=UPI000C0771AE|nr:head maturation protease, ClpP-related [Tepidibacter mesophilus]